MRSSRCWSVGSRGGADLEDGRQLLGLGGRSRL